MLELSAITIAMTDAQTDVDRWIPQSHGVKAGVRPEASRKPSGRSPSR